MKSAVVMINLGTPEKPDAGSVRRFLREFLSDRRVVEVPRLIWLPILYCIILPFRSRKVAKKYREFWMGSDSPLRVFSQQLVEAVAATFSENPPDGEMTFRLAMTYQSPTLRRVVIDLLETGHEKILFLPLYPQYSATTTAPVHDRLMQIFAEVRNIPQWGWIRSYYDHPLYLQALAASVRKHWESYGRGEKLLMSFHGIPKRNVERGDPYRDHCEATAVELARLLELSDQDWAISFQSRLGRAEWLQPYTDNVLKEWGAQGLGDIDVICPAFAVECLETLEEIDSEAAEIYLESGGGILRYIPCLNASPEHVQLMQSLIRDFFTNSNFK